VATAVCRPLPDLPENVDVLVRGASGLRSSRFKPSGNFDPATLFGENSSS